MTGESKADLRARVSKSLLDMDAHERQERSDAACDRLIECGVLGGSGTALAYAPIEQSRAFPDRAPEVDCSAAVDAMTTQGRVVAMPRADFASKIMVAARFPGWASLVVSDRGLREPGPDQRVVPDADLSLVLAPGLAFDALGGRLGRGGGFYDRFLARLPMDLAVVCLALECQIVDHVPTEPHDRGVGLIATEDRLIRVPRRG